MSANMGYLAWFMTTMMLPGLLIGYGLGYTNQCAEMLSVKLHWPEDKQSLNESMVGSSLVLGMSVGAVAGGWLMKIGRRKAQFVNIAIGVLGTGTTMFMNFPCLLIGRFLYGLSIGLFSSVTPRYIEETCPNHIYGSLSTLFVFAQTCGNEIAFAWGEVLPSDKDHPALLETEAWRAIFFYFPLGLYVLFAATLLLSITYEPIKYSITKGNHKDACYAARRMYMYCTEKNQDLYIEQIKKSSGSDFSGLTVKDALVDPQYRTATWVNVGYIIFHELTGINVINLYSTTIFKHIQDPNKNIWLTPRRGTYLVGAT